MHPSRSDSHADPILQRLRRSRLRLNLTFQQVALRAGLHSAGYIFHIENGHKVPSEDVASRIAGALGEDEQLVAAWARALQRGNLRSVLDAAETLLADPELAAFAAGAWRPPAPAPDSGPALVRWRVPVIPDGADPGDALRPACETLRVLSLAAAALGPPEALARPFAYVLAASSVRRVPHLGAGRIAVISRAPAAIEPGRVFAVRAERRVELARVMWNGRALLMLPAPGRTDFDLVEAPGHAALEARIVGFVARVLDPDRIH